MTEPRYYVPSPEAIEAHDRIAGEIARGVFARPLAERVPLSVDDEGRAVRRQPARRPK